jgi:hypothetical protein
MMQLEVDHRGPSACLDEICEGAAGGSRPDRLGGRGERGGIHDQRDQRGAEELTSEELTSEELTSEELTSEELTHMRGKCSHQSAGGG